MAYAEKVPVSAKEQFDILFACHVSRCRKHIDSLWTSGTARYWSSWDYVPSETVLVHVQDQFSLVHRTGSTSMDEFKYANDGRSRVVVCSKSSQRAMDELQRTIIEIETRYKGELSRLKKKYESELRWVTDRSIGPAADRHS